MSNHQPTTGAMKLAKELETWPHPRHAAQIDRHVAPLVEALSGLLSGFDERDFNELETDHQGCAAGEMSVGDVLRARAALQQWKDGKG